MKSPIFIFLLIPFLTFGQVKMEDLIKQNGLSYIKGTTIPFTGKAVVYFPNGGMQTLSEYKDGMINGELKSWYKKDIKQIEGFVDKGKKTGIWKLYFENGKLKKQSAYQNDTENGEETFWFENGNLQKKGSYINGKLNGKYEWYYENGQKQQEGFFVKGKEDSTWNEWFDNGKQKMAGQFVNFEKDGNWTWWDETGKITTVKTYNNGLVTVNKDNFDSYLEKMEFFITKKNYKEALKNVELAEGTLSDKTEADPIFMALQVYHSKCYSFFSHYRQGEKVLLNAIGLSDSQSEIIQSSHLEKSPERLKLVIQEIKKKDKANFQIGNHIALGLCYNLLGDSIHLQEQQQLTIDKGQMQDWIVNISLELYKLASERANNYAALENISNTIHRGGLSEKLELDKAHYLIRTEQFEEAQTIVDKYLMTNDKNLTALLLGADIEMALSNVEKMKIYEDRAIVIDPEAFSNAEY